MKVKEFIGKDGSAAIESAIKEAELIESAIKEAELNTSGEIRVHIESECKVQDPVDRAIFIFNHLKMFETKDRNGVLIYVAVKSKKFAIIGDCGINEAVPANFWDDIKDKMRASFVKGEYINGLTHAIKEAGISLKQFFPYQSDDVNEQPDEISFGE